MAKDKIDIQDLLEVIGNEAAWALGKAEATYDILALLVAAIAKTQPVLASELRRSLKALLESKDLYLSDDFKDISVRLYEILDDSPARDTFESVHPYISSRDVEQIKKDMFSPRGDNDPKKR